jgi:uncharacterized membrane protein HdeD (DUF308 family)
MNEIENNKQKPEICKLAICSPLLVIFGFLFALFSAQHKFISDLIPILTFRVFLLAGIVVGILACYRIHKSHGKLKGKMIAILGIIAAIFLVLLIFFVRSIVKAE